MNEAFTTPTKASSMIRILYRVLLFLIAFLVIATNYTFASTTDSLIRVLKNEIAKKKTYDLRKESKLRSLKADLKSTSYSNLNKQYEINLLLVREYATHQRDSAMTYAQALINTASKTADSYKISEAKLKLVAILIPSGMFNEAKTHLESIQKKELGEQLRFDYYHLHNWLYWALQTSYNDVLYSPEYITKEHLYKDSALRYADQKKYETDLIGHFPDSVRNNAAKYYPKYLNFLKLYDKENSYIAARLAYMYSHLFKGQKRLDFLLISSIADVRNSTKETAAMVELGKEFFAKGDLKNASIFLKEALESAEYYGSRLHKMEISSILPSVSAQKIIEAEQKIFIIVIMVMIMIFVLAWIWYSRTRLKSLNQKISFQNKEMSVTLEALQQSQTENAWIMRVLAHDLRSTIAANISVASALKANEKLNETEGIMLNLLENSNNNALGMISDLLNISVDDDISKEPVELSKLLTECIDFLQPLAKEKAQQVILQTEPLIININKEKIRRLIHNLIVNAMKFSNINSEISVSLQVSSPQAIIKVADNGIGIPQELRDIIFSRDASIQRAGTSGEQSFGLGLFICKQIAEAHRGKIWTEDNKSGGTIFYITLPLAN
jgi:signal transduction histidine kinase